MRCLTAPTVLLALLLAPALAAQLPPAERVPLTDPIRLAQLGYPSDADNVHLLVHPPAAEADLRAAAALAGTEAGSLRWTSIAGFAMHPQSDSVAYQKGPGFLAVNGGLLSLTAGAVFEGQVHMAQSAFVQFVDIFGVHNQPGQTLGISLVERCLPFLGGGNPTETVLTTRDITDQGGAFRSTAGYFGPWTDSVLCTYHVRARFGSGGGPAPGVNMQLAKVRLQWLPDRIFGHDFEP